MHCQPITVADSSTVKTMHCQPITVADSSTVNTMHCQPITVCYVSLTAHAGSRVVRIDPFQFLAGCRKPGYVWPLRIHFSVCCYLLGPLFVYDYFAF